TEVAIIYVPLEPDAGGASLRAWLASSPLRDRVKIVPLPGVKDVSELHVQDPDGFRERWDKAVAAAIPLSDTLSEARAERTRLAWTKCAALAQAPRILDRVPVALRDLGLVGEERGVKLVYLCVTSRRLDRPVSVVVKGPSSAGKSFVVDAVL